MSEFAFDQMYSVYNPISKVVVGDDFSLDGAIDSVEALNREDNTNSWTYAKTAPYYIPPKVDADRQPE